MYKTILLLDDDPISNFLAERLLIKEAFCSAVIKVVNATEGLKFLEEATMNQNFPDLVIFDLNMPVISGWEFIENVKSNFQLPPTIKFIAISNVFRQQDIDKLYSIGVLSCILKPFTKEKFLKALQ